MQTKSNWPRTTTQITTATTNSSTTDIAPMYKDTRDKMDVGMQFPWKPRHIHMPCTRCSDFANMVLLSTHTATIAQGAKDDCKWSHTSPFFNAWVAQCLHLREIHVYASDGHTPLENNWVFTFSQTHGTFPALATQNPRSNSSVGLGIETVVLSITSQGQLPTYSRPCCGCDA